MNSKKEKALVLGLILQKEGRTFDQLEETFRDHIPASRLRQALAGLEHEGRVSQGKESDSYAPTDALDRIQESVNRADMASQKDIAQGYRLPSSLIEALKQHRE